LGRPEPPRQPHANQPARAALHVYGHGRVEQGQSSSNVYWQDCLTIYNRYLRVGETANRELFFEGGAGGQHNESYWSRRLPSFFNWALDPWREANLLALELYPPGLQITARPDGTIDLRREELGGFTNFLATSADRAAWNTNAIVPTGEAWDAATNNIAPSGRQFWRLRAQLP